MIVKFILFLVIVIHLVFFVFAIINSYKYKIQDEAKLLETTKKRLVSSFLGVVFTGALFWSLIMWIS